jgi:PKD repeat protein
MRTITIKSIFLLGFASLCSANFANAQTLKPCGTKEAREELVNIHPEVINDELIYNNELRNGIAEKKLNRSPQTTEDVYVIPIVFHILHQNGAENISDAQIYDQVNILNRDYRKLNADTAAIVHGFDTIAADIKIEFRLARLDPQGKCTNGIDRIYSGLTNQADDYSKLNGWPRERYLNVWVVKTIGSQGVAGYAYYPGTVASFWARPIDGVLILHDYIGSVGTSQVGHSRALTHEIGHYLSLSHTWGDTNNPGVACGDDGVDDTPFTKGSNLVCNLNMAVCTTGVYENVQNYMDYSYCTNMFTRGQKDRMRTALESPTANRSNLYQLSNLIVTGTNTVLPICTPKPDFSANRNYICAGGNITFSQFMSRAPATSLKWEFQGGNPATSTALSPTITYANPGTYYVKLKGTNSSGSDSTLKTLFVHVYETRAYYTGLATETFETPDPNFYFWEWWSNNYNNDNKYWKVINGTGYNSNSCMSLNAFGSERKSVDEFVTPPFELTYIQSAQLTFRCSAASAGIVSTDVNDVLKVYVSTNCGQTWSLRKTFTGGANFTNWGYTPNYYTPTNANQWLLQTVPIGGLTGNVKFKFEYTSGNASNNIYIDDININGTLGVNDLNNDENGTAIYPNPSNSGLLTVNYNVATKSTTTIELMDVLGKSLKTENLGIQSPGNYSQKLDWTMLDLKPGIYLVRFSIDSKMTTKKLMIVE